MKSYKKLIRYGILRRFKRGITIGISLTFNCNYHCHYCTLRMGNLRHETHLSLQDWKLIIATFPVRIKEIFITGGEPTIMPYFSDLVNWITDRRTLVTIFTNLYNLTDNLNPSPYLRINATYHHHVDEIDFRHNYNEMKRRGFQITVDEIGYQLLYFSDLKPEITDIDDLKLDNDKLRISPSGHIYTTCYDLFYKA